MNSFWDIWQQLVIERFNPVCVTALQWVKMHNKTKWECCSTHSTLTLKKTYTTVWFSIFVDACPTKCLLKCWNRTAVLQRNLAWSIVWLPAVGLKEAGGMLTLWQWKKLNSVTCCWNKPFHHRDLSGKSWLCACIGKGGGGERGRG